MSEAPLDFPALANLPTPHSVVLNLGTLTPDLFTAYHTALFEYNTSGWPVILDPVAAGATEFRTNAAAECLEKGYADVIKGNESEIMAVAGWKGGKSRGVDSIESGNLDDRCRLAAFLASRERTSLFTAQFQEVSLLSRAKTILSAMAAVRSLSVMAMRYLGKSREYPLNSSSTYSSLAVRWDLCLVLALLLNV
jgi:hydroxyethylthiazole kinase-like sugar kinase family protein